MILILGSKAHEPKVNKHLLSLKKAAVALARMLIRQANKLLSNPTTFAQYEKAFTNKRTHRVLSQAHCCSISCLVVDVFPSSSSSIQLDLICEFYLLLFFFFFTNFYKLFNRADPVRQVLSLPSRLPRLQFCTLAHRVRWILECKDINKPCFQLMNEILVNLLPWYRSLVNLQADTLWTCCALSVEMHAGVWYGKKKKIFFFSFSF